MKSKRSNLHLGRKAITFLLLFVFLVNAIAFLNVYQFMMHKKTGHRDDSLRDQNTLQVVTLHGEKDLAKQGFKRVEKGEYIYKGKWYDVVKTSRKGDSTVIQLAHDSYEEELISFLKSFFIHSSTIPQKRTSEKLKHDILKQYLGTKVMFSLACANIQRVKSTAGMKRQSPPFLEVLSPPPQLVLA